LMRKKKLDVYLTFSHYLPQWLNSSVFSIVGVSNLAPFSIEAWEAERGLVRLKMWLLRRSIVSSVKRADKVIALSRTCERVLVEQGVGEEKITVIPNGVERCSSDCADGIESVVSSFGSSYILSVSHFHRYKNFDRLVEAYSLLTRGLQQDFSLVIVGKPYNLKYFNEIKDLIAHRGIDNRVFIIPGMERAQLDLLYRNASLFVFPSLIENSPNILLEAMAYGLPILASNIDPMPEFGGEGICYFDGLSATDLVREMDKLLSDLDGRADFGRRAKLRANSYSWSAFTEKVVKLCRRAATHG